MNPFIYACGLFSFITPYEGVEAYLRVEDPRHALQKVEECYKKYPHDPKLFSLYLKVLAQVGKEKEMLQLWHSFHDHFPEEAMKQDVLEEMGWGILKKGADSSQSSNQLIALIGATLTQDRYAVPFLLSAMRSSSIPLRHVGVQLATMMRDHELIAEVQHLIHHEKHVKVRAQALLAAGQLGLKEELSYLMNLMEEPRLRDEEKMSALQAIIQIKESFSSDEIHYLVSHPKSQMRLLAAVALKQQLQPDDVQSLTLLLQDTHHDVVVQAIHCAGVLGVKEVNQQSLIPKIRELAQSSHASVALTACWYLLLMEDSQGEEAMLKWINHHQVKKRREAAAAIANCGKLGLTLAQKQIRLQNDSYVKLNLALGLIGQRVDVKNACDVVVKCMRERPEKWMREESSLFEPIVPSALSHRPEIPYYPEMVNQKIRLELTHLLSLLSAPEAPQLLRELFINRQRGVTSLVGEVLLGVGDDVAVDHVYQLLEDEDPKIRLEAALVLGISAKEKKVLPYLIEAFHKEQKQGKLQIIEAIGRLGGRESLPFLIEQMENPSLNLRLAAAAMLIMTLKG
jgi:HEAT repeat protein